MDKDEHHEVDENYKAIFDEVDHDEKKEESDLLSLKKRICILQSQNPDIEVDVIAPMMKKLSGKTKEELEHIISNMEVSSDPSILFAKAKAALRVIVWAFEVSGFRVSYDRLMKRSVLLRYLDRRLPSIIGDYADEFEILTILVEEVETSEKEKKDEEEERRAAKERGETAIEVEKD